MRKVLKLTLLGILIMGMLAMVSGIALAGDDITVVGKITDDNQIVDDNGNAYDVADTDKGNEVMSLVGQKVQVQGTLMDEGGQKVIEVTTYKVIEE